MQPIKYIWAIRAIFYKLIFAEFGNMSYFGKPLFVEGCRRIHIGNRTRIFPSLRIQAIGNGKINIGNNVAIQQNVHITSMGNLKIEDNVTVLGCACITNIDHNYEDIQKSVLEQSVSVKDTVIGEGSFIGYGAMIQAGTILGKHCVVGANAVVRGVFPDYCVIVGVPARVIKKYNPLSKDWEKYEDRQIQ